MKSAKQVKTVKVIKNNPLLVAVVVLLVAGLGTWLVLASHASVPIAETSEAESGAVSGNTAPITDPTASGGKAIQFGTPAAVTSTGGNAAPGLAKGVVLDDDNNIDNDINAMASGGIKWARGWSGCDASGLASMALTMEQHGINYVPTYNCVDNNQDGYGDSATNICGTVPAAVLASYGAALKASVLAVKGDGIHYWEIGNEMDGGWNTEDNYCNNNANGASASVMAQAEETYTQFLKVAYQTIHANDSQGVVLYGGLSDYNVTEYNWMQAMLTDPGDPFQYMDGMSFHPYSNGSISDTESALNTLVSYMKQNSVWTSKPIWVTEVGCWTTGLGSTGETCGSSSESVKASYATGLLSALQTWDAGTPYQIKTPMMWYDLVEQTNGNESAGGFGLLNGSPPGSLSDSPAYTAYSNFTF